MPLTARDSTEKLPKNSSLEALQFLFLSSDASGACRRNFLKISEKGKDVAKQSPTQNDHDKSTCKLSYTHACTHPDFSNGNMYAEQMSISKLMLARWSRSEVALAICRHRPHFVRIECGPSGPHVL